jgi:hypothetical protein
MLYITSGFSKNPPVMCGFQNPISQKQSQRTLAAADFFIYGEKVLFLSLLIDFKSLCIYMISVCFLSHFDTIFCLKFVI